MTNREQLTALRTELATLRTQIVAGALTPEQRTEYERLDREIKAASEATGREDVAAITAGLPEILAEGTEFITVRLSKEVLSELLVLHAAGLDDEDHFGLASDSPENARLFAAVQVLRKHVFPS